MTPVSDAFSVLECFTVVSDIAEEFLSRVKNIGKANLTGVTDTSKATHYQCQQQSKVLTEQSNYTDRTLKY
jgi:hypothetical protein